MKDRSRRARWMSVPGRKPPDHRRSQFDSLLSVMTVFYPSIGKSNRNAVSDGSGRSIEGEDFSSEAKRGVAARCD
jgi:hypothetical protein